MDEKRRDSADTVPISREELERMLGLDKEYAPVPDDENPTAPDLMANSQCAACGGSGKTVEETSTGYRGPVKCKKCRGSGLARASEPPATEVGS